MDKPLAVVRPVRTDSGWVFVPVNEVAEALCKRFGHPWLTIEELHIALHPDQMGERVAYMQPPWDYELHEMLHPPRQ